MFDGMMPATSGGALKMALNAALDWNSSFKTCSRLISSSLPKTRRPVCFSLLSCSETPRIITWSSSSPHGMVRYSEGRWPTAGRKYAPRWVDATWFVM